MRQLMKLFFIVSTLFYFACNMDSCKMVSQNIVNSDWSQEKTAVGSIDVKNDIPMQNMGINTEVNQITSPTVNQVQKNTSNSFIKTNGTDLVDESGSLYIIKGMAFGNDIWSNSSTPSKTDHTEESYAELAELGFNTVKFYLNYRLFESDENPYVYYDKVWEWLDENIAWAKKHQIKLILNMHIPQGGRQHYSEGLKLWGDEVLQNRLCILWGEIAKRYYDEPTIIGYSLLNEPRLPALDTPEATFNQWRDLAQEIIDEIRAVDQNHVVFLEKVCDTIDMETGKTVEMDYDDSLMDFVLINDENIVYEFHFYSLTEFTHQGLSYLHYSQEITYGDDNIIQVTGKTKWITESKCSIPYNTTNGGWQCIKGDIIKIVNPDITVAYTNLCGSSLGTNGEAIYDDIIVEEYDEDGNYIGVVYSNSFDTKYNYSLYQPRDKSGTVKYISTNGYRENGAIRIYGTRDYANASDGYYSPIKFFEVKENHSYQISGYINVQNSSKNAKIYPMITFCSCTDYARFDYSYIEKRINKYKEFSKLVNAPVLLGEFGTNTTTFTEILNGGGWVEDVLKAVNDKGIGYCYHVYHQESFGFYMNNAGKLPLNRNEVLYKIFINNVSE